jgi:hypothetical protein
MPEGLLHARWRKYQFVTPVLPVDAGSCRRRLRLWNRGVDNGAKRQREKNNVKAKETLECGQHELGP